MCFAVICITLTEDIIAFSGECVENLRFRHPYTGLFYGEVIEMSVLDNAMLSAHAM